MNAGRTRKPASPDAVPPSQHAVTPPAQIDQGLKAAVEDLKIKVDILITWKNRIEGGAAVLVVVLGAAWAAYAKFGDYLTIKAPEQKAPTAAQSPAAPPASARR